jgi:signal transduction histidine kinase
MNDPTHVEESREELQERLFRVADLIHSLNQPLTTVFGQLDLLNLRLKDPEHKKQVEKCLSQAERASAILGEIAAECPRRTR